METQDLKTLILQEAGDFDHFDISAALKLSDEGLNQEIQKIRKRIKWFKISRIFIVVFTVALIFNIEGDFLPIFNNPSSFLYAVIILALNNNLAKDKKKEYIYQLLLKFNKLEEPALKAVG